MLSLSLQIPGKCRLRNFHLVLLLKKALIKLLLNHIFLRVFDRNVSIHLLKSTFYPAVRSVKQQGFGLEVCGSTRTRGYTRPDPYPRVRVGSGRVGYGYDVHGYGPVLPVENTIFHDFGARTC